MMNEMMSICLKYVCSKHDYPMLLRAFTLKTSAGQ